MYVWQKYKASPLSWNKGISNSPPRNDGNSLFRHQVLVQSQGYLGQSLQLIQKIVTKTRYLYLFLHNFSCHFRCCCAFETRNDYGQNEAACVKHVREFSFLFSFSFCYVLIDVTFQESFQYLVDRGRYSGKLKINTK